jgi:hypothetical protein
MLRQEDAARHRRLNTRLVIAPMIVEAVTAIWLLAIDVRSPFVEFAFLFWVLSALGTAAYTYQHWRPFDRRRLSRWNLLRAIAWTARSALLIFLIWIIIK